MDDTPWSHKQTRGVTDNVRVDAYQKCLEKRWVFNEVLSIKVFASCTEDLGIAHHYPQSRQIRQLMISTVVAILVDSWRHRVAYARGYLDGLLALQGGLLQWLSWWTRGVTGWFMLEAVLMDSWRYRVVYCSGCPGGLVASQGGLC